MKVRAVTAFVPLEVKHLTREQYKAYGRGLKDVLGGALTVWEDYPYDKCWAANYDHLPPAQAVPSDRYASPAKMVMSNVVQHQRTTWALMASYVDPEADVIVWLDYAILKQGAFTGKPVQQQHVLALQAGLSKLEDMDCIPFPGIWPRGNISDNDANWRFCGSTHIWPTKYLQAIDRAYKHEAKEFFERTRSVPNDLPIWAHTEANNPQLPFAWYQANHDATQLTNFPGG